jgi:hypothetical protein
MSTFFEAASECMHAVERTTINNSAAGGGGGGGGAMQYSDCRARRPIYADCQEGIIFCFALLVPASFHISSLPPTFLILLPAHASWVSTISTALTWK